MRSLQSGSERHRVAILVFEDRPEAGGLRWLKRGFRHCFCVLGDERRWTICDPLKAGVVVDTIEGLTLDELVGAYRELGATALIGAPRPAPAAPKHLAPFTCVELAKRLVGLEAPMVLTPYQLFRRLSLPGSGFSPATT
jgi:hypothetical protein